MEIEIPLSVHQILCLVGSQGCTAVNRTRDRTDLDGDLLLGIGTHGRRSMKMRSNNRTGQATELDVVLKLVRLSIKSGRYCSSAR